MARINEFSAALQLVDAELRKARDMADKANPVLFGEERLSKPEYVAARFHKLGKEGKLAYIKKHGIQEVVKLMKGFNHGS